jgi:hypothetical protein
MLKNIFLGAGPMSLEIVNSLNNFSKKYKKKIMLICSRNQIEAEELGGGYVNNFNTKTFSNFIQGKKNKNLILSRDHSGPYKRDGIKNNIYQEIEDCKKSLKEDIKNNFKILHIDTSMCGKKKYEAAEELINFCNKYALYLKKNIFFEFGCEEHGVLTSLKKFKKEKISIELIDYSSCLKLYDQNLLDFIPHVSLLDILFREGPKETSLRLNDVR